MLINFLLRCQSCSVVTIKTDTIDITSSIRDVPPHELLQQQQQQHKLYLHDYNYVVTVLQKL